MAELVKSGAGVFVAMVSSGTKLTERAMGIPLGVIRTVRDEAFRATYAGVDWIEGVNQSSFRVAREVLQRIDKLTQEAVTGLETVTGSLTNVIRGSGEAASEMIMESTVPLAGGKEPSKAATAAVSA